MEHKIKEIEKIVLGPNVIKEFDGDIFESMIEKIIIGRINEKKEKEPNVIRFILKTGESYEANFVDRREKLARKKLEKNMVPKGSEKVV